LYLRDSSNTDPVRSKIPVQAKVNANTSMATAPLSGWAASTPAHKPAVSRVVTVTVRAIRGFSRAGWGGGWAEAGPAGRSKVSDASSALVREASV